MFAILLLRAKMQTTLSNNIRAYRQEKGYTQEEFCKLTGISRQSLQKHETGVVKPSSETLEIYAKVLGVDVNKLRSSPHPKTWGFAVFKSLNWD